MNLTLTRSALLGAACITLVACGSGGGETADAPKADPLQVTLGAGDGFEAALQTALIEAKPGATITLPEGTFNLTSGLSLDADGVTIRGAGQNKTILDFAGQTTSGEGLLVTSDNVTMEHFTVHNPKGDGIKSKGADNIIYRDLTVEWTRGPNPENGAYAIYPVESENVLVERVTVRASSDAGIYVGQSNNIIVRDSLAEYNVAGIEIENSSNSDVYNNRAVNNTGGILIFDLPDLPIHGGANHRIFNNVVADNNTPNFAPPGGIVGEVMSGTGMIVMASRNVHVFDNEFRNNKTGHVMIVGYTRETDDETYDALPDDIVLRDNSYEGGGDAPEGVIGDIAAALGGSMPPVVWDGGTSFQSSDARVINVVIAEDESVGFINLGAGNLPINPASVSPSMERPEGEAVTEPTPIVLPQDTAS